MLRTDKPIYKVILVFNLLLIAIAVVLSVISISGSGATTTRLVSTIIKLASLLFAGFYIVSGYRKNAAKYYKVYGILYMFSIVLTLIACIKNTSSTLAIICNTLPVIGILALVFVKDFGKTKALITCAILVLLQIVCVILANAEGDPTIVKINIFMSMDLACLLGIMTYAKYLDKAERGTK